MPGLARYLASGISDANGGVVTLKGGINET